MAEQEVDIGQLSEDQQLALQQFTSVTDQPLETAIPLLRRCQWNVQIAIARFFDGEPDPVAEVDPTAASRSSHIEENLQESLLNGHTSSRASRAAGRGLEPAPRIVPQPDSVTQRPSLVLALFFLPFNVIYSIASRAFNLFSHIFPFLPRLLARVSSIGSSTTGAASARRALNTRDTAARFIREMEEEYGTNELPFVEKGYAHAYDDAKKDLHFLMIVLLSPEHDDTSSFVRNTLFSPDVTAFIKEPRHNLILWGGNVRDAEAYKVASDLNVTKFPFVGLIVHAPSSPTSMSLVARIAGPVTSTELVAKLQAAMRQHASALERTRATRAEQQASRNIREEQDSAYERSLAQDRERARQRREAEAARAQQEQQERERQEEKERYATNLAHWKRWKVASTFATEPAQGTKDVVRVAIRLPSGERATRRFPADAPLEDLYAFVECYEVLQERSQSDEKESPPQGFQPKYRFTLVSPMPRQAHPLDDGGSIRERLGSGGGNLIVEQLTEEEDDNNNNNGDDAQ